LDSRIVGAQAPQVTLISAQFSIAIDRPSQLVGVQAPQTMVATAVFTPSSTLRSGLLVAQQAPQVAALTAVHNFSGGIVNKRYGRK
jgi:2-succinyl-5-enolpyruvyl-6-hydroxy-3-cyclohexene-1-carboxylate synthase